MGLITKTNDKITYLNIIRGTLRTQVDKNTLGSQRREYETSDGRKGEKWELVYDQIEATIVGLDFKHTDFGEQLEIKLKDENNYVINIPTDSNYFTSFAKKIKNVDISKPLILSAYDFTDDRGKRRKGVTLYQNNNKIKDYFYKGKIDGKHTYLDGYPTPENDGIGFDKDDWKLYFIKVKKYLKGVVSEIGRELKGFEDKQDLNDIQDFDFNPEELEF